MISSFDPFQFPGQFNNLYSKEDRAIEISQSNLDHQEMIHSFSFFGDANMFGVPAESQHYEINIGSNNEETLEETFCNFSSENYERGLSSEYLSDPMDRRYEDLTFDAAYLIGKMEEHSVETLFQQEEPNEVQENFYNNYDLMKSIRRKIITPSLIKKHFKLKDAISKTFKGTVNGPVTPIPVKVNNAKVRSIFLIKDSEGNQVSYLKQANNADQTNHHIEEIVWQTAIFLGVEKYFVPTKFFKNSDKFFGTIQLVQEGMLLAKYLDLRNTFADLKVPDSIQKKPDKMTILKAFIVGSLIFGLYDAHGNNIILTKNGSIKYFDNIRSFPYSNNVINSNNNYFLPFRNQLLCFNELFEQLNHDELFEIQQMVLEVQSRLPDLNKYYETIFFKRKINNVSYLAFNPKKVYASLEERVDRLIKYLNSKKTSNIALAIFKIFPIAHWYLVKNSYQKFAENRFSLPKEISRIGEKMIDHYDVEKPGSNNIQSQNIDIYDKRFSNFIKFLKDNGINDTKKRYLLKTEYLMHTAIHDQKDCNLVSYADSQFKKLFVVLDSCKRDDKVFLIGEVAFDLPNYIYYYESDIPFPQKKCCIYFKETKKFYNIDYLTKPGSVSIPGIGKDIKLETFPHYLKQIADFIKKDMSNNTNKDRYGYELRPKTKKRKRETEAGEPKKEKTEAQILNDLVKYLKIHK